MPKKIFDILPPESKKPLVSKIASEPSTEKRKPPEKKTKEEVLVSQKERKTSLAKKLKPPVKKELKGIFLKPFSVFKKITTTRYWFAKLSFSALILAFFLLTFVFSQVEIVIWPESKIVNLKETVTIDPEIGQINLENKLVPGELWKKETVISQEFSATGKVLKKEKARGVIRVYNTYSNSPQILVANTRFVSNDGKLFRSTKRVVIPGGKEEGGEFVPGFLDVEVVAAEPGPEYNIGPSTFSIPGFAGTPKYTAFYGKSFEPMEGGFIGEVSQVTENDIKNAKDILIERAKKEGEESLKKEIESNRDYILLKDGIYQEVIEATPSVKVGQTVEKFEFRVKVESSTIVFKRSDLEKFAKEFIKRNTSPESKKFSPKILRISYYPESIEIKEKKIILNLEFFGKIYNDVEEISFKKALAGKSVKEAEMSLKESPHVAKAQLKLFPFWLRKIPESEKKIRINFVID